MHNDFRYVIVNKTCDHKGDKGLVFYISGIPSDFFKDSAAREGEREREGLGEDMDAAQQPAL